MQWLGIALRTKVSMFNQCKYSLYFPISQDNNKIIPDIPNFYLSLSLWKTRIQIKYV